MTDIDAAENETSGVGGDNSGDDGSGGWIRRRRWWILVAVVAIAALLGGAYLAFGDDDGAGDDDGRVAPSDRPTPTPPPAVGGEVDEEGQELLDLLEAGHERTYHATYVVNGDPDVVGNELRLDVWRDAGLVRQDMRQVTDTATVESASFLLTDDETIACQRVDAGEWTCARQSPGDEFTAAGLFGNIARELEGVDVVATDDEIGDRAARCFTLPSASGEVSQCMSEDGIPLRRSGDGAELVLVDLSEDVPDDIFTPPAEPVSGN